eukprot:TRINITY_DN1153_c0_g1_i1.p1 TRINITY_DN1153_c0_g1~~TRINITY_DN1153_c0_g1_i1.p1  ORF type:complete len:354 (+),score=67.37 TRINITY_DN1153_c0_g1_i1:107-1168(+)
MIRRPPRSTLSSSSAASDVYKRQVSTQSTWEILKQKKQKLFMALPLSLKGNFLSLGKFFFQNVLKDDYPHKKFEVETYKAITKNNNVINYKTECTKTTKNNATSFQIKDELKLGAQLGKKYLQTRVKRDGEIKYHLDLGTIVLHNKEHNLFAALKTNMQLNTFWARFGIGHVTPTTSCWKRIEKNYDGEYSLSNSMSHQCGPIYLGMANIYNLSQKKLEKCDLVCNYNKNGIDFTLQHLAVKNQKCIFPLGKVLAAIGYKINNQYSIATWYKKNLQTAKQRLVFGVQSKPCEKLLLKAKTDCNGKTSLSSKFNVCSAVQCTVGFQLPLKELIKNANLEAICKLPFGYSFDINL